MERHRAIKLRTVLQALALRNTQKMRDFSEICLHRARRYQKCLWYPSTQAAIDRRAFDLRSEIMKRWILTCVTVVAIAGIGAASASAQGYCSPYGAGYGAGYGYNNNYYSGGGGAGGYGYTSGYRGGLSIGVGGFGVYGVYQPARNYYRSAPGHAYHHHSHRGHHGHR
jgi:hypothetical protein